MDKTAFFIQATTSLSNYGKVNACFYAFLCKPPAWLPLHKWFWTDSLFKGSKSLFLNAIPQIGIPRK